MRRRYSIALCSAALLALVAWWSAQPPSTPQASRQTDTAATAPARPAVPLASTPQARAWRERQAFEHEVKRFLREADGMGAVARSERVRAFAARIDDDERAARMSAGEAFLLRAALIEADAADAGERAGRLADLALRYRDDAARREAAWAERLDRDPGFRDYKQRERAIVEEVAALRDIPGGLTRDEYLRRRLQQAREDAYR